MATGHFTQLVWKSSKSLGMGMAAGKHAGQNAYYCTAQYSPPGNIQGQFRENVLNNSPPIEFESKSLIRSLIFFVLLFF